MKPVTITKRQLDRALVLLFSEERTIKPRVALSGKLYDYAWTLWAKSQGNKLGQGKRAAARAQRATKVIP